MSRISLSLSKCGMALVLVVALGSSSFAGEQRSTLSRTDAFIAYLGRLKDTGHLGEAELRHMHEQWQSNHKIVNPISEQLARTNASKLRFRQGLARHLEQPLEGSERVATWVARQLGELNGAQVEREAAHVKTEHPFRDMEFVPASKEFEVQTMPVTQWQYANIVGAQAWRKAWGTHSFKLNKFSPSDHKLVSVGGVEVEMCPECPMVLSPGDFIDLINELNDSDPQHTYHFPSSKERMWVVTDRGRRKTPPWGAVDQARRPSLAAKAIAKQYGHRDNVPEGTWGRVGGHSPLLLGGKPVWDLISNREWVHDFKVDAAGGYSGGYFLVGGLSFKERSVQLEGYTAVDGALRLIRRRVK